MTTPETRSYLYPIVPILLVQHEKTNPYQPPFTRKAGRFTYQGRHCALEEFAYRYFLSIKKETTFTKMFTVKEDSEKKFVLFDSLNKFILLFPKNSDSLFKFSEEEFKDYPSLDPEPTTYKIIESLMIRRSHDPKKYLPIKEELPPSISEKEAAQIHLKVAVMSFCKSYTFLFTLDTKKEKTTYIGGDNFLLSFAATYQKALKKDFPNLKTDSIDELFTKIKAMILALE